MKGYSSIIVIVVLLLCGQSFPSILNQELIVNGSAETGDTSGWIVDGVIAATGDMPGLPDAVSGNYFLSGIQLNPYAYQEINVSDLSSLIDNSQIEASFSVWLASPAMDPVSATLTFLNQFKSTINSISFGPPPLDNQWRYYETLQSLPYGTRFLRIQLDYWCTGGVVAEGCADDISLTLIPEPNTLLLLGLGVLLIRKR